MNNRLSFPRTMARQIIESLDIRHPREIEIEQIAYTRGLMILEDVLEGSEGRLLHTSGRGFARINANIPEQGRKRFTMAHELGHFELHKDSELIRSCEDIDISSYRKTRPGENEANEFAAELLMPEHLFQPLCKSVIPCFDTIGDLADQFRTSLTATAIRYVEYSPYSCAIIMSQDKIIKWHKRSEEFPYYIEYGSELNHNTVAFDFFDGKELPSSMDIVLASSWIKSDRLSSDAIIKEQAIAIRRYNTVLSFLWVEDDIEEAPY